MALVKCLVCGTEYDLDLKRYGTRGIICSVCAEIERKPTQPRPTRIRDVKRKRRK